MVRVTDSEKRIISELILITGIGVLFFVLMSRLVWVYEILSLAYLLVERKIRRRPLEKLGIKRRGIAADLEKNFPIIVFVAVVMQLVAVLGSYWLYFPLFLHLQERVAYLQAHFSSFTPTFLFFFWIVVATFMEELVFRGFVQERVSWFYNDFTAIAAASFLMSLFHYSFGLSSVVLVDLLFVFIDSCLYGLIYMRSRNVFAVWMAHLLADVVSLTLLWIL